MIQSILIFILGFLSALFLALLLLPAIWRRAVRLTTRGIERSLPISMEEMRASRDQLRARQAVELRRIEIERDEAMRKAAGLVAESGKERRRTERYKAERANLKERATQADGLAASLQAELQARDTIIAQLAGKAKEAEDVLADRIDELGRLGDLYEEAALSSTARQVEVIARESEVERLKRQLAKLRSERTKILKQTEAGSPTAETAGENDVRLVDLQQENLRLISEIEALRSASGGDEALRESMHQLAADVVTMVSRIEGQAEPIEKALSLSPGSGEKASGAIVSLAERIRKRRPSRS